MDDLFGADRNHGFESRYGLLFAVLAFGFAGVTADAWHLTM
jgi:hypothetical protein